MVRKGSDERRDQCRECHAGREAERLREKRKRERRQAMGKDLTALARIEQIDELYSCLEETWRAWGGRGEFVGGLCEYIAYAKRVGGFPLLRAVKFTVQLMQHVEANPVDLSSLTDQKLDEREQKLTKKILSRMMAQT